MLHGKIRVILGGTNRLYKRWWDIALENIEQSLIITGIIIKPASWKASILRKMEQKKKALKWVEDSLFGSVQYWLPFERYLLTHRHDEINQIKRLLQDNYHTYLEYALILWMPDYTRGCRTVAIFFRRRKEVYPIVYYTLGYIAFHNNDPNKAKLL